jgi:ABC-type cobalt transport system substrate-binding protein
MKKLLLYPLLILVLVVGGYFLLRRSSGKWAGVDETVVEKFARAAGHPPHRPLIDTEKGDLLLFCFLVAGILGGFVMGYCFHELFPPTTSSLTSKQPEAEPQLESSRP